MQGKHTRTRTHAHVCKRATAEAEVHVQTYLSMTRVPEFLYFFLDTFFGLMSCRARRARVYVCVYERRKKKRKKKRCHQTAATHSSSFKFKPKWALHPPSPNATAAAPTTTSFNHPSSPNSPQPPLSSAPGCTSSSTAGVAVSCRSVTSAMPMRS